MDKRRILWALRADNTSTVDRLEQSSCPSPFGTPETPHLPKVDCQYHGTVCARRKAFMSLRGFLFGPHEKISNFQNLHGLSGEPFDERDPQKYIPL